MKVSSALAIGASLLQTASAHYIWQTVNGSGVNQYIRANSNYNSPVTDTSSNDLRCNVGGGNGGSTQTLTVAAGTTLTLGLDVAVYHQGPVSFYLGRVPSGQSASSWDGSGANWFKFEHRGPSFSGGSPSWPMSISYQVRIPTGVPSGNWLLRAEQIGIHNPGSPPQFYVGCAQLSITGGGSCAPSYVSIPGHVRDSDSGLTANIYSPSFTSYTVPGPAPNACNGGSNPQPTTTAAPTTRTTSPGTTRTTTPGATTRTTTPSTGTGAALWAQCGGSGWSGPTTCAQGRCVVLNPYYSQCQN